MAGTVRIMVGLFFVIVGLLTMIFLIGIIPLLMGMAFIAWGQDARRRKLAEDRQWDIMVQQTQILQHMVMSQAAASSPYLSEPSTAERYCQICGAGNTWGSSYCQKCGKPLPPPNVYYSVDHLPSEGEEASD